MVYVVDTVRTNQMPNMNALYNVERNNKLEPSILNLASVLSLLYTLLCFRLSSVEEELLPEANHTFEVKFEKDMKQVHKGIQRQLSLYKDEKRGATFVAVQSPRGAWPMSLPFFF